MKQNKQPNQIEVLPYRICQGRRNIFGDIIPPEVGEYYILSLKRKWYSCREYLFVLPLDSDNTCRVILYADKASARRYDTCEEAEKVADDIRTNPNDYILS